MIRKVLEFIVIYFLKMLLWFRYKIEVKGMEKLNDKVLNKPGGVLFLPNHPTVFVDATALTTTLWPKYILRPLIIEYMYQKPVINWLMRAVNALPIPNFAESSNSYKRKKGEQAIQGVIEGIKHKDNFLIFPAGRVKLNAYEALEGASAVHRIIQEIPQANIVLVRIKGLWGSSFSRALTGQNAPIFKTIFLRSLDVLKNLLFFTPRRKVIIEFEPAPADFPYKAGKMEFNRYLEAWYNQPDGLRPQTAKLPGDSLVLVSFSMWGTDLPKVWEPSTTQEEQTIDIASISPEIQKKVVAKIAELTSFDPKAIKPEMSLTIDLGMDSLDISEIIAFLQDQYDITNVALTDLTTVAKIMALAGKQLEGTGLVHEELKDISKWKKSAPHHRVQIAKGETLIESFLNNCTRMGNSIACSDMRAGILTYPQLKMRVLLLAEYIRHLPGKTVGIMLPASAAASITIFACELAGKIPLMINWTVGPRHLQTVVEVSDLKVVLTSWAFIDRLQNVDLNGIDDLLVMLEDVRKQISLKDKLQALVRSKMGTKTILKTFGADKITKDDTAVLLFTSGTESNPKGVPLTHHNLMSNQKAILESIALYNDDIVFGILPPFHSFGFTICCIMGLLSGVRVAFSPDPTDSKRLAKQFELWGITLLLGPPTFVKGIIRAADPQQLKSMRLCLTGAEKLPPDLVQALDDLGKGDMLFEGYGITECSPLLTFNRIGQPRKGVGQPLDNVKLCIVDLNTHKPLPTGEHGLILALGPNIFSGYINPGLASPFISINGEKWYNTGDLGYLEEDQTLHISGRLKRFIKIGGEMISLTAIEEALLATAIKEHWVKKEEGPLLAVCGKEIPGERPQISLFSKFPTTVDEINKALRNAGFSNLVKVTSVNQLSEIPVMGTGKVNYRKLEQE